MLRLPPFAFVTPRTLEEAVEVLREGGAEAMVVAGGTDLYPNMKRRQFEPKIVVALSGIDGLRGVRGSPEEGLRIGPLTTLSEVSAHPMVREHYFAFAKAAGLVSTPPLRNMGTIGGNLCVDPRCNYYNMPFPWRRAIGFCIKKDGDICLVAPGSRRCWALSSSDAAPVAMALEAELSLVGPAGPRRLPAKDFYRDDGIDYLNKARDEILTEIRLPPANGYRTTYWKLRRRGSFDFPILGVAARLGLDARGRVHGAKLVLGAVSSKPLEVPQAAEFLDGKVPTEDDLEAVANVAFNLARPMDNADGQLYWRKKLVKPYVKGALSELLGRATSPAS